VICVLQAAMPCSKLGCRIYSRKSIASMVCVISVAKQPSKDHVHPPGRNATSHARFASIRLRCRKVSMISVRQVANPYEAGVVCVLQAAMPCSKHGLRHLNRKAAKQRPFASARSQCHNACSICVLLTTLPQSKHDFRPSGRKSIRGRRGFRPSGRNAM